MFNMRKLIKYLMMTQYPSCKKKNDINNTITREKIILIIL